MSEFKPKDLVRLSEETEKAQIVKRLLKTMSQINETVAEKKWTVKTFNGQIADLEVKKTLLAADLEAGVITVPIEVMQVSNLETGQMEYWDRNGILVNEFTTTLTGEEIELEKKCREAHAAANSQTDLFPADLPELEEREWAVGDLGYYRKTDSTFLVLAVQKGRSGVAVTDKGAVIYFDLWTILCAKYSTDLIYSYTSEAAAKEDFAAGLFSPHFLTGEPVTETADDRKS